MSFKREIDVRLSVFDQGNRHLLIEVIGPGGKPWFNFCITPKTLDLNMRAMSMMEPFIWRIRKLLKKIKKEQQQEKGSKGKPGV